VAAQLPRKRGSATASPRRFVSASVRLDVNTHARVAAAAALAGIDRSTWINRAIDEALRGIVVFDKRSKSADHGKSDGPVIGEGEAA
jgi:hypothetical protein